ncbi:MAG: hypothetical protein IJS59_03830 [Bacteroidaceae bacterium]|nr:hypothetical protein [Bacteroidaceae bacterium]
MIAACGLSWACSDDYKWDDEKPTWLNASIYESLQEGMKDDNGKVVHTFSNYLRLLEDKDVNPEGVRNLKDVLSKTGSKTVFVADDDAWQKFFQHNATLPANNPWHNATSYERLSPAQKKLLIHTSMLNNAIVMENLASSDGNGTDAPLRGQYMRRFTDVDLVDSVTFLPAEEVPTTYNPDDDAERNFWKEFDTRNGGKGIYLVMDSTLSMMLHFTQEHMSNHLITNDDFRYFMGRERATRDVHIYDALLLEQDGVAENGYVNVTEKVVAPLPNMAEVIRTNGKTNIFSHMMDRFSYPYQNQAVTENYKKLHPEFDGMIYTKKYFAQAGPKGVQSMTPTGKLFDAQALLQFDPGWNEFYNEFDKREDMAAMFVPNDEAMLKYFAEGGAGWQLVRTYATDPYAEVDPNDLTTLYRKIDMVPLSTLYKLINVIMFPSFNGSVPSKMMDLRDYESQENMFTPDDLNEIDTCILACNGAVYVMDKVYGPASYVSVAAPANISKTNMIMQWAINNGANQNNDKMHLNYSAYLMAMRSQFTFFLPSDEALTRYYDPVSFTSRKPRIIRMGYNARNTTMPVLTGKILYAYDTATGTIGDQYRGDDITESEIINRLKDILESHTIVHDGTNPIDNEDEYYVAKNYAAIKVTKDASNNITKVQGGFQLENERAGITAGDRGTLQVDITTENTNRMDNGITYVIDDSPLIPTSKSVYNIITKEFPEQCSEFYDLTDIAAHEEIVKACGLTLSKLLVWLDGASSGGVDQNVKFFNNYLYTVFVPTNDAIEEARARGLQTWDDIVADYESLPETDDDTGNRILNGADSLRLQAKITYLSNFIRTHFVDNSVFADKSELAENEYVTSSYDTELGSFVKVVISRAKSGGQTTLYVRDEQGGSNIAVEGDLKNIMSRDIICLKDPSGNYTGKKTSPTGLQTMNDIVLQSSSFAVIHQIGGVLNHKLEADGSYPDFDIVSECRRYLKRFPIVDAEYDEAAPATMRKAKHAAIR